jgi:hypothetical protein
MHIVFGFFDPLIDAFDDRSRNPALFKQPPFHLVLECEAAGFGWGGMRTGIGRSRKECVHPGEDFLAVLR